VDTGPIEAHGEPRLMCVEALVGVFGLAGVLAAGAQILARETEVFRRCIQNVLT
jgi:hypothetical protein